MTATRIAVSPEEFARRLAPRRDVLHQAAAWISDHAPDLRDEILESARAALTGRIRISGGGKEHIDIGTPPAWKEIRTPDSHYGSDLNRMGHWQALVKAFVLTGEAPFAERLVAEALSWIERCPRPALPKPDDRGVTAFYSVDGPSVPWHCLNSGIRLFETWRVMLEALSGTPFLTADTLGIIAHSMREQAEAIRSVSPRLFPDAYHNHYLMESLGILAYAALFPELPDARDWGREAAHELDRCALAQLSEDGAQVEGCPGYHNGCMYWFCLARQLAFDSGTPLSEAADARLRRSFTYAIHATRPMGTDVPWGDSHAGTGFVRSAIWALYAFNDAEPLAQAERFADPQQFHRRIAETLWEAPDPKRLLLGLPETTRAAPRLQWPRTYHERTVKQASLRTGWDREALGVFFAAYSPVHYGFHGHIDPCGFDFSAFGAPLVADSGCCAYYETERRRQNKSATGHNMLTVNFREPFEYCHSFAYGPQKEGGIDWVVENDRMLAAQGFHTNYAPALHRRAVVLLDNRMLVVLDSLTDLFWLSSVQLYYQMPCARADILPEGGVASCGEGPTVMIVPDASMKRRIDPYRLHPEEDAPVITTVRFDDIGLDHRTERAYATVIVPVRPGAARPTIRQPEVSGTPERLEYAFAVDGTEYALIWTPDGVDVR